MTATFYLGAHHPHWLATAGVPLFVSRRALGRAKALPRAVAPWALDSGGFTELSMFGAWQTTALDYVRDVRRFADEVGMLAFAAPQDWMCEPEMIARTGLSVAAHQQRTIDNYLELRMLAPELPIIPVLQGWSIAEYWRHLENYARAGVDLAQLPLVGVGTVCRRQHTGVTAALFQTLRAEGLELHGFGIKVSGLRSSVEHLASADSMAWSLNARRNPPRRGCSHRRCSNCLDYALEWRDDLANAIAPAVLA
jgi:hypothetical protein